MDYENKYLEEITANFHSFYVEGFNIFALDPDQLPHLICACPNKNFARAISALGTASTVRRYPTGHVRRYMPAHCIGRTTLSL